MNPKEKADAIREFFLAPEPRRDVTAMVVGCLIVVVGLFIALKSAAPGFGIFVTLIGLAWALLAPFGVKTVAGWAENEAQYFSVVRFPEAKARFDARPSFQQVFQWLKDGFAEANRQSAKCLGLLEEDITNEPITIFEPCFNARSTNFASEDVLRRWLGNGYFYSTYRIVVFQFTPQFLGSYRADYNMLKDVTISEEADEVFYQHVAKIKVSSDSSNLTLAPGEKLEYSKTFTLGISSGENIYVELDNSTIRATDELVSLGDNAVANIRAMLRRYKDLPATA